MTKGILIDIDNTLYDYNHAHTKAMDEVFGFSKNFFEPESFKKAFLKARQDVHLKLSNTASSHNRLLYFQKTLEELKYKNFMLAKDLYDIYWNGFLNNMELFDGVEEFFIKNKSKKICFVTDLTAYIQYRKIKNAKLSEYVDYIVTSEEVGVEKPHPEIFKTALNKINLEPKDVCMIGDSYEKDIKGALNIGIKAFWYSNTNCEDKNVSTFKTFKDLRID